MNAETGPAAKQLLARCEREGPTLMSTAGSPAAGSPWLARLSMLLVAGAVAIVIAAATPAPGERPLRAGLYEGFPGPGKALTAKTHKPGNLSELFAESARR